MLNIPAGNSIFNHLVDGGTAVCIDAGSGLLTTAYKFETKGIPVQINPIQNPTLQTVSIIPYWKKVLETLTDAHTCLDKIPIIGWDIAVTEKGPVIIEGNHNIALNFHQLPPNLPFGKSPFAEIVLYHLNNSIKENGIV